MKNARATRKPRANAPTDLARPLLAVIKNSVLAGMAAETRSEYGHGEITWEQEYLCFVPQDLPLYESGQRRTPSGLKVVKRALQGPRVAPKGPRYLADRSGIKAHWPAAGVQALRAARLVYVLEGPADLQVDNYLVTSGPGHFFVVPPEVPFVDGTKPHLEPERGVAAKCSLLWLAPAGGAGLGCWICHSRGDSHFERPAESCYIADQHAVALFEILAHEAGLSRPDQRKIVASVLDALWRTLCREIEAGRIFQFAYQKAESGPQRLAGEGEDPIAAAKVVIKDNLHRNLTIDEVARKVFLSRTEFTHRFRAETGTTFVEFTTRVRLEEARALLVNTQWSIALIGEMTGLRSSRLRVLFRQRHGQSPQEYRKAQLVSAGGNTVDGTPD